MNQGPLEGELTVKTAPKTVVTFIGGPLSGRSEIIVGKLPAQYVLEPHGSSHGRFFWLPAQPGQPWSEWLLIDRPAPVVYRLEGLDCYRAVEP